MAKIIACKRNVCLFRLLENTTALKGEHVKIDYRLQSEEIYLRSIPKQFEKKKKDRLVDDGALFVLLLYTAYTPFMFFLRGTQDTYNSET